MSAIERAIDMLGWELRTSPVTDVGRYFYRAEQRKFSTAWRESPELVLADLHEMKRKDMEAETKP